MKAEGQKILQGYDEDFLECRDMGHRWLLKSVHSPHKVRYGWRYVRDLHCDRCGMIRVDTYERGEYRHRYVQPDGYKEPAFVGEKQKVREESFKRQSARFA